VIGLGFSGVSHPKWLFFDVFNVFFIGFCWF